MAAQIRPDEKLKKIAYKILKTPESLQQKTDRVPSQKRLNAWLVNSSYTALR